MKKLLLVLLVGGCVAVPDNPNEVDKIARGGCDRQTGYGIQIEGLGFNFKFMLNAKCETLEDE